MFRSMNMTGIPRAAMLLGFAGVLPFLWGVASMIFEPLQAFTLATLGPRFVGPFVLLSYGTVILSFMSGVLWGFAAADDGPRAALGYGLSVLPALWAFFFVGGGPVSAAIYLIAGYLGVLGIDWLFWKNDLTPKWWMALRIPLTTIVVVCLGSVII